MKNWGEKVFLVLGWVAVSPFLLSELVVRGFKWIIKKIKRKWFPRRTSWKKGKSLDIQGDLYIIKEEK